MAISREEDIKEITKWLNCTSCDSDECFGSVCVECQHHYEEYDFEKALRKAISDMQKLEKIEQELYLLNNAEFEIPNNAFTFVERVEQLLKGEN